MLATSKKTKDRKLFFYQVSRLRGALPSCTAASSLENVSGCYMVTIADDNGGKMRLRETSKIQMLASSIQDGGK